MGVKFDGLYFEPVEGLPYKHDYSAIIKGFKSPKEEFDGIRHLLRNDLFFLSYFCMRVPFNNRYWVETCNLVQDGPQTDTCDIWAREHGKTTIISVGNKVRQILNCEGGCDRRMCILSFAKDPALKILRVFKELFERSDLLKYCFPEIFWQNVNDAPKWSEDQGLVLRRSGYHKEATIEAWGLIDGMPTGSHFTDLIIDDVVTDALVRTPERMAQVEEAFNLAQYLGSEGCLRTVTGTFYRHDDPLTKIVAQKDPETGAPLWHVRIRPGVEPASFTGASVFLSEDRMRKFKASQYTFATQILCNPTPKEFRKLQAEWVDDVNDAQIPKRLWHFIIIDPAGKKKGRDSWAIGHGGFVPYRDELGLSDLYLLELIVRPMDFDEAMKTIVEMYIRAGKVIRLGVENPANSTWDIHIQSALRAKKKFISEEAKTLVLLSHHKQNKEERILANLSYPMSNGKIHLAADIPEEYRKRFREEIEKFPAWHDDALDMCAYFYDLIKDYRFPAADSSVGKADLRDRYARSKLSGKPKREDSWLYV